MAAQVLVVGGGISGAACAGALRRAGCSVEVRERGRAPGGRLASPSLHGRRVDLGAAYFTVAEHDFAVVVDDWRERGLVRPWLDTLDVYAADGTSTSSGPMRFAAPGGLRSLARDLHEDVVLGTEVAGVPTGRDAVVLAMPDPQAARLAPDLLDWVDYEPVIAVAAGFAERTWSSEAAFVNDDASLSLIADDGARRGDGAPVLVLHTTSGLAGAHLADPDGVIAESVAAARRLLGVDATPDWTFAHRWTFAKPAATHGEEPYWIGEAATGLTGVCGDSWCPSGKPRVESAWLSGHRLGTELAVRLGAAEAFRTA